MSNYDDNDADDSNNKFRVYINMTQKVQVKTELRNKTGYHVNDNIEAFI
jgi:hypothetical protein